MSAAASSQVARGSVQSDWLAQGPWSCLQTPSPRAAEMMGEQNWPSPHPRHPFSLQKQLVPRSAMQPPGGTKQLPLPHSSSRAQLAPVVVQMPLLTDAVDRVEAAASPPVRSSRAASRALKTCFTRSMASPSLFRSRPPCSISAVR